jgi:probable phosphoglycerate mutase
MRIWTGCWRGRRLNGRWPAKAWLKYLALPKTPFWFLRHGETDYNARGLSQGAIDIPLNDTGRVQAGRAGPVLAGRGITAIYSSPMLRTRETTAIVNESLGLDVIFEPDLREVIFGGMEGKPLQPWFTEWMEGRSTPAGAESFAQVTARAAAVMERLLVVPGPILIVSHGGVFRAMRDLMGLAREGLTPNAMPLYCEPTLTGWRVTQG